jgi:DHA1 family bicyclomycin/chloramphenicol resistance-like MFS transporter
MSHKTPLWRVLRNANLVQLVAGLLLLAAVLTNTGGLAAVFACIFAYIAAQGFVFPNGSAIAMMRHGDIAGTASALLGTNQFLIAAIATIFLGLIENPAVPMAMVIAGCAVASTVLNYLTLGERLEVAPQAV